MRIAGILFWVLLFPLAVGLAIKGFGLSGSGLVRSWATLVLMCLLSPLVIAGMAYVSDVSLHWPNIGDQLSAEDKRDIRDAWIILSVAMVFGMLPGWGANLDVPGLGADEYRSLKAVFAITSVVLMVWGVVHARKWMELRGSIVTILFVTGLLTVAVKVLLGI